MSFLGAEALLVARMQAAVDAVAWGTRKKPRVFTAADAANVEEQSQLAPAYYVVLDSYAPTQENQWGRIQQIEQQWVVYCVLRNAAKHATSQGVRDDANQLIDIATAALCGWKPGDEYLPLRMLADTGPIYSDAGFGYFPLRFETRCVVRGA